MHALKLVAHANGLAYRSMYRAYVSHNVSQCYRKCIVNVSRLTRRECIDSVSRLYRYNVSSYVARLYLKRSFLDTFSRYIECIGSASECILSIRTIQCIGSVSESTSDTLLIHSDTVMGNRGVDTWGIEECCQRPLCVLVSVRPVVHAR